MIDAARSGELGALRRLLDDDPRAVHARGWMGETALHAAAAAGRAEAVRMLLAAHADPRARRDNGDTPLHRAATGEIAELLRQGRPDQRNEHQQTPLHCATDPGVVEALIRHGGSLAAKDFQGRTPLHGAGAAKTRALLAAGAELEARDSYGRTPLHVAVWDADAEAVALLLAEGADPAVRDDHGSTPVHLARTRGPEEVRRLMDATCVSLAESVSAQDLAEGFSVAGHATLVHRRRSQPDVIVATEHSAIRALAVHPLQPLIAIAPADAPVELRDHDLAQPELLPQLVDATVLAFSPDGRHLAAAVDTERLVLFDLATRQITAEVEAGERTDWVVFSPDGTLLATACSFQGGSHIRVDAVTPGGQLNPLTVID
ncbi:ankyrin repeat domain-containing protein [Actinoplanes solisilvae]|uniref:ankyrin repeat domain-containing protein n=1 Tax=Actinoplanes solisilvae TaxID=2486853 RepID=UPI0013E294B4|nr:ankyrin repeat domain-containing protein [Actinoplanes solisilvae]